MSTQTQDLTINQVIKAPPSQVYRAFTNATALREWLSDGATTRPQPGGRFYLWWHSGYYTSGEFISLEPDRSVSFTWQGRGEPAPTQVKVTLDGDSASTKLCLSHTGEGKVWEVAREEFQKEWSRSLENLVSVMETGQDLRVTNRPMLGINVGDFNTELAAKLGTPVTEGIRLDGVLEGMGAYSAGLRKDDVIVGIQGKVVTNFPSLVTTLQENRAGDRVEVEYYRGPEKLTCTMELSRRPIPEITFNPIELAEQLKKIYDESNQNLFACFEGITEAQASKALSPGEWSANGVLAHLIQGERENHSWITDLEFSQERVSDEFGDNSPARISATLAAYPTTAQLIDELKRNQEETIHFISELPESFKQQKGSFWRMAFTMVDTPAHTLSHLEQIQKAISAARS